MSRVGDGDRVPVSVVIPCYCCADTIERAVLSVAKQVVRPSEVILVDDGSPDQGGTLQSLHALQQKFRQVLNIKIFSLDKNQGPAAARNAGWDISAQPYIAFLDADDSWHPQKLKIQYEWMLSRPDVDISGHLCQWGGMESQTEFQINGEIKTALISKRSLLFHNAFSTPTVMLKRSLPLRFIQGKRHAEDYLLWLQAACKGYRIARLELPLATLHKAPFGEAGLSAEMWAMEKGVQDALRRLEKDGMLNPVESWFFRGVSLLKYIRRLLLVGNMSRRSGL